MQAARDSDWLTGESRWFPASEAVPESLAGEATPSEEWSPTTPSQGGRGWMRQRLEPLGPQILYTTAWAPFFLLAAVAPLAFPGRTPDDQSVATALFAISWALLLIPFLRLKDGLPNRASKSLLDLYPFDVPYIALGVLTFPLHILVDTRIGWLSFVFFALAQYRTIRNFTDCAGRNSARWLLPLKSEDYSPDILARGWVADSSAFRNGPLARWKGPLPEYAADLIGVTRGDSTFVAFTVKHRGGTLHDPFSDHLVSDPAFADLLASPPLVIGGEAWADRFRPAGEQ